MFGDEDESQFGESLLDELDRRSLKNVETRLQRIPGANVDAAAREFGIVDYIEEYAIIFILQRHLHTLFYRHIINRLS